MKSLKFLILCFCAAFVPSFLRAQSAPTTPVQTITVTGQAFTTSTNVLVIESGPSRQVIIKRITIWPGTATANGWPTLTLDRNTAAASAAGTAATSAAMQHSPGNTFSGVVRTGSFTVVGITSTATSNVFEIPTPASSTTTLTAPMIIDLTNGGTQDGFIVPSGTTNGVMFVHSGIAGGANFGMSVDFSEQ